MASTFRVDRAKTGRSKCKGCKEPIEKDSLRIGKVTASPFSDDSEMTLYVGHLGRHLGLLMPTPAPKTALRYYTVIPTYILSYILSYIPPTPCSTLPYTLPKHI